MKKEIKIKTIPDNQTKVEINSPTHRIEEIKQEFKNCFDCPKPCKAEVLNMWEEETQ